MCVSVGINRLLNTSIMINFSDEILNLCYHIVDKVIGDNK